jgi:hypothetical protein
VPEATETSVFSGFHLDGYEIELID